MAISDWSRYTLGDVTENFDSIRVPLKESDRKRGRYPYYGASGIIDMVDGYLFDGEYLLVAEDGENLRSRKTPIAFIASGKFWVNNHSHVVQGNQKADTKFLMYYLSQTDISGFLTGSTIPKLTQENLNRIPIYAPPLQQQRAIAEILAPLDDKITLNRKMNATLEKMARATFRRWFVESNKRGVWEPKSLYDCAEYINGAAYRDFDFSPDNSGLPIIKIAEIKDGITSQTKFTNKQIDEKYRICDGDILFAWSGSPDTSIDISIWSNGEGWLNQHIFKVIPPHPNRKWFTYLLLKDFKEVFIEIARDKQTTGLGHVTVKDLSRLMVAYPPDSVLIAFAKLVDPIMKRLFANEKESRTLANLRDTLLPKLMKGEVRVKDMGN